MSRPSALHRLAHAWHVLSLLMALAMACSKATEPHPHLTGRVQLAAGASGDLAGTQVQLFGSDPFAPGATPARTVGVVGSGADVGFDFGEVGHGDMYVVAWKDDGDGKVGPGDLQAWYDGALDASQQPSAAALTVLHGQDVNITLHARLLSGAHAGPAALGSGRR